MKYKSRYPIDLCLAYMKNDNINDVFEYTWEECEGKYCITYLEYKHSIWRMSNCPKSHFEVCFQSDADGTIIEVTFMKTFFQSYPMFIDMRYVDSFWEKKLDAVKIE